MISSRSWRLSGCRSPRTELRDLAAARGEEVLGRRRRRQPRDRDDEVVLAEERSPAALHHRGEAFEDSPSDRLGAAFELGVLDVDLTEAEERRPLARKRPRERQREHAVVEELDAQLEAVDICNVECVAVDDDGRYRVLEIGRCGGLGGETSVDRAATDGRAERRQVDLLGDVEQVERGDRGVGDGRHGGILTECGEPEVRTARVRSQGR